MELSTKILEPVAVALHTRDRLEDYRWYPTDGACQLVEQLKDRYRALIADQDAQPASTFLLVDDGERIGLLVANLKTQRFDHLRTRIDDTIVLEFVKEERESVFRLAAGLLATESPTIQQQLLDYAEKLFQQKEKTCHATVEKLAVPATASVLGSADLLMKHHVGFRCNEGNQQKVAGLLHHVASRPDVHLERPFVVVSTGLVGKDKLQQEANHVGSFIALTRSSSVNDEVTLRPAMGEKKKTDKPWPTIVMVSALLLAGLLGVLLGSWMLLGNKSSARRSQQTPGQAFPTSPND
jgi:hypothetical protein